MHFCPHYVVCNNLIGVPNAFIICLSFCWSFIIYIIWTSILLKIYYYFITNHCIYVMVFLQTTFSHFFAMSYNAIFHALILQPCLPIQQPSYVLLFVFCRIYIVYPFDFALTMNELHVYNVFYITSNLFFSKTSFKRANKY